MRVKIEVSSSLKKFMQGVKELEFENHTISVKEILKYCPIPEDEVGIIIINGKKSYYDSIISNGDEIKLYPPIIAG
jgi:hypothetical protein